jgi:hypothetical protein
LSKHRVEPDVGEVCRDVVDDLPPQRRGLEDSVLVHERQVPPPRARKGEGAPGDPLDLPRGVLAHVECRAVREPPLPAVVEAPRKLPDDQYVHLAVADRTEVRVDAQLAADVEEPLLRAYGRPLELGRADRGEQHRVGLEAGCEGRRGQGIAALVDPRPAERPLLELQRERKRLERALRLPHHLGTDPVAAQTDDLHLLDRTKTGINQQGSDPPVLGGVPSPRRRSRACGRSVRDPARRPGRRRD